MAGTFSHSESVSTQSSSIDFKKALKTAGESTVVSLEGAGIEVDVLIHDMDLDPVTDVPIHADFYAIEKGKKLSVDVGIPTKLEAIKEEDLKFLAESAHADACAPGNPKDASVEDLKDLFRKIM